MSAIISEPTFDADGYPTEATLGEIERWPCIGVERKMEMLAFVQRAWRYPEYFHQDGPRFYVSTGGWSGNESLIGAMQNNHLFWSMCAMQWTRGGHYIFEVTP